MNFLHCLRAAVYPDGNAEARIESIVRFCRDYGFGNVMLFINAEEFNCGHMTTEEARPFVDAMKRAAVALRREGIGVSINAWISIGHLARGRKLKDGQAFKRMTDMNGLSSELVACPLDRNWLAYYREFISYLLGEIPCDVFWIEDDFRLHNHAPLEYGGCFCAEHVALVNAELGTDYSREELVRRIFAAGACTPERKAWFEVNRREMSALACKLGKHIRQVSPRTQVGLMSSLPAFHAVEMRDWKAVTEGFAAGGEKIDRIHLPCYEEVCGKHYGFQFAASSMLVRTLLPEDTHILPELENGSFSPFSKDARFLRFQLESSLPLLPEGMTYDIFDFVGNGAPAYFGYGTAVRDITPYLNGVLGLNIPFSGAQGVVIPFDERSAETRSLRQPMCWSDLLPDENQLAGYLSQMGISFRFDTRKHFSGRTVALCGNAVNSFTDSQLRDLFRNNFVFLEGGAALRLIERGLGALFHCGSAERLSPADGLHSYEETADGVMIDGISGYRASSQEKAGDYVRCNYVDPVSVCSYVYNYRGQKVGRGIVKSENFVVLPYVLEGVCFSSCVRDGSDHLPYFEQFNRLRVTLIKDSLLSQKDSASALVVSGRIGVTPYVYADGEKTYVILVNYTVESSAEIVLSVNGLRFERIAAVGRDGQLTEISFRREGREITVELPLEYLSTATLVLQ